MLIDKYCLAADLSAIVYFKDWSRIISACRALGMEVHIIEVGNSFAIVCEGDDFDMVAMRGTDDKKDVIEDLKIRKRWIWGFGRLHRGFWEYYEPLRTHIKRTVTSEYKKIIFVGHSLGAPAAAFAAVDLQRDGYNVDSVITFGMPRAGGWTWSYYFKKTNIDLIRFVHDQDIVPRIPPPFNFWHVGNPLYLKDYKIVDEIDFHINPKRNKEHHAMLLYLAQIKGVRSAQKENN